MNSSMDTPAGICSGATDGAGITELMADSMLSVPSRANESPSDLPTAATTDELVVCAPSPVSHSAAALVGVVAAAAAAASVAPLLRQKLCSSCAGV
jgi:hypothetical protein